MDNFLVQPAEEEVSQNRYADDSIQAQLELISEVEERRPAAVLSEIEEEAQVLEELKASEIDDGFLGLGPAEEVKIPARSTKRATGRARVKRMEEEKKENEDTNMVSDF